MDSAKPNTVGCVNIFLHPMFRLLSVSVNGKHVTIRVTNYHYKSYIEKLLIYFCDVTATHLVSSLSYINSSGEFKDNSGYAKR
jgi:hypothetical protein